MSIEESLNYLKNQGYICKKKDKLKEFMDFVGNNKRGIAFCSGWNQCISQFIPILELTGVSNWLTVDENVDSNPTIVIDLSIIENIKKLPKDYFDVLYLPYCHHEVFSVNRQRSFNNKWFDEIKKLLRKEGKIIFAGFVFAIDRYTGEYEDFYKYNDEHDSDDDNDEEEKYYDTIYREINNEIKENVLLFFQNKYAPLIEKNLNWIKNNIHENTTISILKNKFKSNTLENFVIMSL